MTIAGGSKRKRHAEYEETLLRQEMAFLAMRTPPVMEPSVRYIGDSSLPRLGLVPVGLLDIIKTLDSYANVVGQHESLAARLGPK